MPGLKDDGYSYNGFSLPLQKVALRTEVEDRKPEFEKAGDVPLFNREQETVAEEQKHDGPLVVDVMGGDGALQSLRVKPSIFLGLLNRLDHPVVAHHKRRFGKHTYFAYCGDFIIETRTTRPLALPRSPGSVVDSPLPIERNIRRKHGKGLTDPDLEQGAASGDATDHPLMEFYTAERCYVTEWWNRPEDPALSVARLRVEAGVSTRPYRLRGISERYLFLSGRGIVEIDGERREVGPGDGIFIDPGSWRCITNTGERDLGFLAICRPRFKRLDPNSPKRDFVGNR